MSLSWPSTRLRMPSRQLQGGQVILFRGGHHLQGSICACLASNSRRNAGKINDVLLNLNLARSRSSVRPPLTVVRALDRYIRSTAIAPVQSLLLGVLRTLFHGLRCNAFVLHPPRIANAKQVIQSNETTKTPKNWQAVSLSTSKELQSIYTWI